MAFEKSTAKLQRLLNLMDDDSLTKETFISAFRKVVEQTKLQDEERNRKIQALTDLINKTREEIKGENNTALEKNLKSIEKELNNVKAELAKDRLDIAKRLAEVKDGEDADEEYVIEQATENATNAATSLLENHKEYMEGEMGKIGEQVAESFSRLDDLGEKLEKLEKRPVGVGGGVTNMRIAQAMKTIVRTEQPSGLINGSNTAYTVTQPIFAVLSFSLNGEFIAQLPNYTVAGRTITFSTALPAAYSGKDFEITYFAA